MMTFPKNLFEILSDASAAYGFSIAEITRQTIERAVDAGLLHRPTPSAEGTLVIRMAQFKEYCDFAEESARLHQEAIETLHGQLKLRTELITQMAQRLEEYAQVIVDLKRNIRKYENAFGAEWAKRKRAKVENEKGPERDA